MDQIKQIQQAVEIAIGGTSDYQLKNQAIQFLNELKQSAEGWQAFSLLLKDINSQEQVRFIALQALADYIPNLSTEQLAYVKHTLWEYLQSLISAGQYDQAFLKNKLAETFTALFAATYTNSWGTFFKDFESLIKNENEIAVDQFLRVLLSIHTEIGDQLIIRDRSVQERNNNLKDAIRANDMQDLTLYWKRILFDFKDKTTGSLTTEILKNCLQVIGGWVSWIEISLIVGSDYINLILEFLTKSVELKITCCESLIEIIGKKMKPENKLQLLSLLNLTNVVSSMAIDDNLDLVENVAKLYNAIGLELTFIMDSNESSMDVKATANQQTINLFPFVLNFLSNPYDDTSIQVFPYISSFLQTLKKFKKNSSLDSVHLELLNTLLTKIIIKMKFDPDDDGLDEDSISEFEEFRAKLKVFQETIGSISPDIFCENIFSVINQSIFADNVEDWRTIELGLFELTSLSDSLRQNLLNIPKQQITESRPYVMFQEMLVKTINSNVIQINHPLIQLLFFELIVRHYTLLNNSSNKSHLTNHILGLFTSMGLYHSNEKVKLRCWYLFSRFIKLTKPQLDDNVIENLITNMSQSILIIEAELPQKDEDSEIVEQSSKFDNQLYLFETLGLLIALLDSSKIQLKLKLMDILLNPIFNHLQRIISSEKNPQLILEAHHYLMAIGTIARGFENDTHPNKEYSTEIASKFNNVAEVVIVTLENMSSSEQIRDAARFSFARFIPILKSNIHLFLSRLISILLASNNLKFSEMTDFLGFIGQIVHNFSTDEIIFQLLNDLFTPLVTKVYQMIDDNGENNVYELMPDIIREKVVLKKSFIALLISLDTNHMASLLITPKNQSDLPVILTKMINDAEDLSDASLSKTSINALNVFVKVFANDEINDPQDKFAPGLKIDGISQFLMENLTRLSFEIPFKNSQFDLKDMQYKFIADELSSSLKTLYESKKALYLEYLKNFFVSIQLPSSLGDDLLAQLVSQDLKMFKKSFNEFITKLK